ncbi:predicted protein [Chaetoceros tenuissimus]|uniref:Uncharacterized protein n=1 Tax=Chaetoceros tenuissimus TaxID=426638 RepID=A0AAD3CIU0_9STRA|nr:predicted protein [Chaetoceros tenuissimus]
MCLSSSYLRDKNTTPASESDLTSGINIDSEIEVILDHSHGKNPYHQHRTVVVPSTGTVFEESTASKYQAYHSIGTDHELDFEDLLAEAHDAITSQKDGRKETVKESHHH